MAEGLLRSRLGETGIGAAIGSAGLLPGGAPATPDAVATMAGRGVDISGHVSRTVEARELTSTPLIIGMTRHHVRELCAGYGAAVERTYTLRELVRRGERTGGQAHGESVSDWLRRVDADRRAADLTADDRDDDIADPVGRPRQAYEHTADVLEEQLRRLVRLLEDGPPRREAYADGARGEWLRSERLITAGDPGPRYSRR
jgi:protein-tyrosine phosphatase